MYKVHTYTRWGKQVKTKRNTYTLEKKDTTFVYEKIHTKGEGYMCKQLYLYRIHLLALVCALASIQYTHRHTQGETEGGGWQTAQHTHTQHTRWKGYNINNCMCTCKYTIHKHTNTRWEGEGRWWQTPHSVKCCPAYLQADKLFITTFAISLGIGDTAFKLHWGGADC